MKALNIRIAVVAVMVSFAAGSRAEPMSDDKERAVAALETALKADPSNTELWIHLAFAQRKLDRIDQAQASFEKAVSLSPKNEDALYMLGLIYEKKEMKADALRTWKQYLTVSTNPEKKSVAEKHIHHLSQ